MKLTIDFETYYDKDYSLRKMSTAAYIMDSRFKAHGASVRTDAGKTYWVTHESLPKLFGALYWEHTDVIGHNLTFDGAILEWVYGVRPRSYIDTLGMARYVVGQAVKSHSLDSVYEHLWGLQGKVRRAALASIMGVRDPSADQLQALGAYARDDADQTWAIYQAMAPSFPEIEYARLDRTIKMFTRPALTLDGPLLLNVEADEVARKEAVLKSSGLGATQLRSNPQFAALLMSYGVPSEDMPTTYSAATGEKTWQFTKSNKKFTDMLQHENAHVRTAVGARLEMKSSIVQTRARTLYDMSQVFAGSWLPVPLSYCGAMQTARLASGGGSKLNLQNLGRGSPLRDSIRAPEGHKVVVVDLSNIELRINATMCDETASVEALRRGEDLYKLFASKLYAKNVEDVTKDERFIGKLAMLSLGYGAAGKTFKQMLWAQAGVIKTEDECALIVKTYRAAHPRITYTWKLLRAALGRMETAGVGETIPNPTKAPIRFERHKIIGPTGFEIKFPNLHWEVDAEHWAGGHFWFTRHGKTWTSGKDRVHGAGVAENLSQHLAREVLSDMEERIGARSGRWPAMQVHDELVYVVPDGLAESHLALCLEEMHKAPAWWPDLPVAAEGDIGQTYGDAK